MRNLYEILVRKSEKHNWTPRYTGMYETNWGLGFVGIAHEGAIGMQ